MSDRRKTALVTGSAGFLGRHFTAELYQRGYDVWGYDIRQGDDILQKFDHTEPWTSMDLVVHCAAVIGGREGIDSTSMMFAKNIQMDAALFEWAVRTKQKRVLYISSSAVYPTQLQGKYYVRGRGEMGARLIEMDMSFIEDWQDADSSYGLAKCVGEHHARIARQNGLDVTVVRPFSGYGPDQSLDYPFPSIVQRAVTRGDLTVWGPEGQARDWIHVSDVVNGALAVVESGTDQPVNICTGIPTTMGELAQMAYELGPHANGCAAPDVIYDEMRPTGVFYRVGNPDRFHQYYTPQVTIEAGVREAVAQWS